MKHATKYHSVLLALILLVVSGCATSYSSHGTGLVHDLRIKTVACIGDSITYGSALENRESQSYPTALGRKLGSGWRVSNYGVPAERAVDYIDDPIFQKVIEENPDLVVVMLGANDSGSRWSGKQDFEERYTDLIQSLRGMPSSPRILVCIPFAMAPSFAPESHLWDVIESINVVAKAQGLEIIRTDRRFWNKTHLFVDGVHPSPKGAQLLADEIYRAIANKSATPKDHLRVIGEYFLK